MKSDWNVLTGLPGGAVTITTNNPLTAPIVNPNIMGTNFDVVTMREAFKAARRFVQSAKFTQAQYIIEEVADVGESDASIDAYLRSSATLVFHPTGTAMMTKKDAPYGVVDPDLRVKGTVGLRVVDASIFVSTDFLKLSIPFWSARLTWLFVSPTAVHPLWTYPGPSLCHRGAGSRYHQSRCLGG